MYLPLILSEQKIISNSRETPLRPRHYPVTLIASFPLAIIKKSAKILI